MMRTIAVGLLLVLAAAAKDKPAEHVPTDAEKVLVWRRLYEQAQAAAAKQRADAALQQALTAMCPGREVTTNQSGDLVCAAAPKEQSK